MAGLALTQTLSESITGNEMLYETVLQFTGLQFELIVNPTIIELSGISLCTAAFVSGCKTVFIKDWLVKRICMLEMYLGNKYWGSITKGGCG